MSEVIRVVGLTFGQRLYARDLTCVLVEALESCGDGTELARRLLGKLSIALEAGGRHALVGFTAWELLAMQELTDGYREKWSRTMLKQKKECLYVAGIVAYIFAHRLWEQFHPFDMRRDGHFVEGFGDKTHACESELKRLQDRVTMFQICFGEET